MWKSQQFLTTYYNATAQLIFDHFDILACDANNFRLLI